MSELFADPLAPALLPVVVHELNNATQLLTTMNSMLSMPEGAGFLEARAADLSAVSEEMLELGWLVGALSSAAGDDLLQARRRSDGLDCLVRLVRKGLRRQNKDLGLHEGELPRLSSTHGEGWEAAWAIGAFLWCGAANCEASLQWTYSNGADGFALEMDQELPDARGFETLLEDKVPAARLESAQRLWLPAAYFASA